MIQPHALFIETGHGKSPTGLTDPGAVRTMTENGKKIQIKERDINVAIAREVHRILTTRRRNESFLIQGVGIETSANISKKMAYVNSAITKNKFDPNLCFGVAIHLNSASSSTARGIECWYQKNNSVSATWGEYIAQAHLEYSEIPLRSNYLQSSINSRFGNWWHGKWLGRLYIDDALCPYVVLECGFLSNDEDLQILRTKTTRVAEGIAHGIKEFFRNQTV